MRDLATFTMLSGLPFLRYAAIEWIHFTISSVYLAAHYWEDFIVMSEEKKRFVLAFKETELYRHHGGSGGSAASPPNILIGNVNVQKYFHWSHIEIHEWWMAIGHWALTAKDNVSHWKTGPILQIKKISHLEWQTIIKTLFNCARFENAAYLRFLFHLQFILQKNPAIQCECPIFLHS